MSATSRARVDRRSIRTRNSIARAVIRLGAERGVDALTVRDLARAAGVSRSTFYAHYGSLEDYLARSFATMIEQLAAHAAAAVAAGDGRLLHCGLILDHIASAPGYVAVISRSRFRPRMLAAGEERLRIHLEGRLRTLRPELAADARGDSARFVAAGFIAMLRDWMEKGMTLPADAFRRRVEALAERI